MNEPTPAPEGYYPPEGDPDLLEQPRKISSLPKIAGVLLILAAFSAFFTWYGVLVSDTSLFQNVMPADAPFTAEQLLSYIKICGVIFLIFSAIMCVGGIMAFRRKAWGIAMAGSVLGLSTIGIFFSSSILSLICVVLLIISRKEFTALTN
jgi:hypothetical protein